MENLSEQKLLKEIELLDAELKLSRQRQILHHVKIALSVFGMLAVLYLIAKPETMLNRGASDETLDRERTRLLIGVLRGDDPEARKLRLEAVDAAYALDDDDWWTGMRDRLNADADEELQFSRLRQINTLNGKKEETRNRLAKGTLSPLKTEIAERNLELYELEIERIEREFKENVAIDK